MDNLLEIILPLIFFAIYFASQIFGKKDDSGSSEEEQPEAMRKIREELRKKIEERRQASQSGQQQQRQREPETQTDERAGGAVLRESRQRPEREFTPRDSSPVPQPQPSTGRGTASGFPARPNYDQDLEERMAEVRRSQEKVEAARQQARERIGSLATAKTKPDLRERKKVASYREFLRESLRDPQNLRKSFLLHEVFGTPVGMREQGKMRPSWDL